MINCDELYRKDAILALRLDRPGESFALGQIFAPAFFVDWENPAALQERLHFGLVGPSDIGKSSFLRGVQSQMLSPLIFAWREDLNPKEKRIRQEERHSANTGHVRFMDFGFAAQSCKYLPSYRDDTLHAPRHPGTDFIEHAGPRDKVHGAYALAWCTDAAGQRYRAARFYATAPLLESQAFQKAMTNARERFSAEPEPVPPPPELVRLFA